MSTRAWVTVTPLIGEQKFIDDFRQNYQKIGLEKYDDNKDEYQLMRYGYDHDGMCKAIAEAFPGITFFGYQESDMNTFDTRIYTPVIFNKKNGFLFKNGNACYKTEDGIYTLIREGLSIRGLEKDEYLFPGFEDYFDPSRITNDDEEAGYSEDNIIDNW